MDDFANAIENAQKMPEVPDELEGALPDPFKAPAAVPAMSERVGESDGTKIPHGAKHSYKYNCARLVIGQIQTGFDHGGPIFEPQDDSQELKDIMDKQFQAEAIVLKHETSFLKDGTVIVWLEWAEPVAPPPKQFGSLGLRELLSPEPFKSEDSEDSEDSFLSYRE